MRNSQSRAPEPVRTVDVADVCHYGVKRMIRLRYWIESARCVPVLGIAVAVLFVVVFLVTALDLHDECPLELLTIGCLALVAAGAWLGLKGKGRKERSKKKTWLRGAVAGRAPPVASSSLVLGSFVPGASPILR